MSGEDLIPSTKFLFATFGLPKKFVSGAVKTFVSEWFKEFCRSLHIDQVMTSPYYHQSHDQVDACIEFVKCKIRKCRQYNIDVNFALLQTRSTLGTGIPSPAMLLLNRSIRALWPQIGREPININKDAEYNEALKARQETYTKNNDTCKASIFFLQDLK